MKNVHITLVGGQPAPVYNAIKTINPDKVVYIYSVSSQKLLASLLSNIDIDHDEIELDAVDPIVIQRCAQELAEKYSEDTVTVNISSGTKAWSHFFSVEFGNRPNASIIYIDQNNQLWDYKGMSSSKAHFDMLAHFRLYGNPIDGNFTPFEEYTPEDFHVVNVLRQCRKVNYRAFYELTEKTPETQEEHGIHQVLNATLEWDRTNNCVDINISNRAGTYQKNETLNSPHAVDLTFNTAWFELYIANMLSRWGKSEKIILNCRFPYNKDIDKNEVDIIVNIGNKILFVECKTQINKSTDIDKFRSVIKTYGGMGSKGLFITDAMMSEVNIAKCKEHGIIPFSLQDPNRPKDKKPYEALYEILDSQLNSLNLK